MQADWTVACSADDPEVAVPWAGNGRDDTPIQFVDLRHSPDAIAAIPEARDYPCVAAALRSWNQPDTLLFTAKCDVWSYPARLFDGEDLPEFAYAHGSYIDLLPVEAQRFSSFAACEQQLRVWTEIARSIPLPASRCEWTLRPARIFPQAARIIPEVAPISPAVDAPVSLASAVANTSPLVGFATTLYAWGYGYSPESAASAWDTTLRALIEPVLTFSQS